MFLLENVIYKDILNIRHLFIEKNLITSIMGESGSGKTTLLKLFNKMISPDSGDISYNNHLLKDFPPQELRSKVLMLSQTPIMFDGNIRDNLTIGLSISKKEIPSDDTLIKMMHSINLTQALNDSCDKLSGGEKQRIALLRIILMKPDVLLLDEPSSALDSYNEDLIMNYICDYIKENNKSLIMVTHSEDMAKKYSDRIIYIKKGDIINE